MLPGAKGQGVMNAHLYIRFEGDHWQIARKFDHNLIQ